MISAADGAVISEIKIGDNINATPAILDGRIYVGAFNGKLYCLGESGPADQKTVAPVPPAQTPAPVRSRLKIRRARRHPKTAPALPITPAIPNDPAS
jgi:hypothetical protein